MRFLLITFFIGVFHYAPAQTSSEKIFWKEDGLTWEDFKAQPDLNSPFHANTNAGLSYSWGLKNDNGNIELQYQVLSFFNPNSSWVKPGSTNEYLLKHEQLHFDITELHARKLRKKLAEIKVDQLGKDPKAILTKAYEIIEKERAFMQKKYDQETNHSLNKNAEAKWQDYIKRELNKYVEVNI